MMLENIEWTRVWREEVNAGKKRVLLVGDSIIDGSKSLIGHALGDTASITAFITSKALDNPWYIRELDILLEQEGAYSAIYLNNGLHTGGMEPKVYADHYRALVEHIMCLLPGTPLVLGLSTPVAIPVLDPGTADAPVTPYASHTQADACVRAFNQEVMAIARERVLPYLDAYSLMDGIDPAWRSPDGYHYTQEGSRFFAVHVAAALKKCLE